LLSQNEEIMEEITVKAKFLFELKSKQDWINKVPRILPEKNRSSENFLWLDKNGNVFEIGADFMAAEKLNTYPCKVYRLIPVSETLKQS